MQVDWFRVIVDLERKGYSLERIAAECLRSKGWVSNLKNIPDTEPRHRDGQVLIGLWAEVTSRAPESVPVLHLVRNLR